jgi:serine/threonine protein kinase
MGAHPSDASLRYASAVNANETIGRYTLLRRLAVGGMAEVFLAHVTGEDPGDSLVIKRMLPDLADDQRFRDMFTREAKTMAALSHPGIVRVFELGESDNIPFMTMEYVPGHTLREVLLAAQKADNPLPVPVAIDLAVQACDSAHAAHELTGVEGAPGGVVHRDLTPHNIMVTPQGELKLLDFGIVTGETEARVTETGVLKGKMAYLSPEQIEQADIDRRADVFALAAVTWEMLAGEKLYDGRNEVAILRRILSGDTRDVRDVRADVPERISTTLHTALSPDREHRPPTAAALAEELESAATAAGHPIDRAATRAFLQQQFGTTHITEPSPTVRPVPTFSTRRQPHSSKSQLTVVAIGAYILLPGGPTGIPLAIALAPVRDPGAMRADLEPLRLYLEDALSQPVQFSVGADYAATLTAVSDGEADAAIVPPGVYLQATAQGAPLIAIAAKIVDGSRGTEGIILAREATAVDVTAPGLTVCFADPNSTTGYHLARSWLRDEGADLEALDAVFSGNHVQVLRDLIAQRCDIGATYTGNWTSADQAGIPVSRTRMVSTTGWTPHDIVVVGTSLKPSKRDRLSAVLLEYTGSSDSARQERLTGFTKVDEDTLAELAVKLRASQQ